MSPLRPAAVAAPRSCLLNDGPVRNTSCRTKHQRSDTRTQRWRDDAGMCEVDELIQPGPLLMQERSGTDLPVEVLPGDAETGRASLLQLRVSARSTLGGSVLHSGGLLVNSGWLRIFGSPAGTGAERLAA